MRDGSHGPGGGAGGSREPFLLHSAHVGKIELGSTTVTLDDETITIIASAGDERSARVRLATIDSVHVTSRVLTIELRDGTHLRLFGDRLVELRATLLESCRTVPELTRALRAFGSRRGQRSARATGAEEQHRFFTPLLIARRAASVAITPADVISAFDADALSHGFNAAIDRFAEERFRESPPARRALTAELSDLAEPLLASLDALRVAAKDAIGDLDNLRRWREWAGALRGTFETADRVWLGLDAALDAVQGRLPPAAGAGRGSSRTPSSTRRSGMRRRSE
jgi:hypothetical protein